MAEGFACSIAPDIRFRGPDVAFILALRGIRQSELVQHRDRLSTLFAEIGAAATISTSIDDDQSEIEVLCQVDPACDKQRDCDFKLLRCWSLFEQYARAEL